MNKEYLEYIEDFIFVENKPAPADIIFVPGNRYPQNAERAAWLYDQGYAPYVLPSGHFSIAEKCFKGPLERAEIYNGAYQTEWEFLRDVLIKNHVPAEAILKEDQATFTYQNALLSKNVIEQAGIRIKKAILCCKNYHARRSLMYYQTVFPEVEFLVVSSSVDGITKKNWKESEKGIDEVMAEMTRIVKQFSLMM